MKAKHWIISIIFGICLGWSLYECLIIAAETAQARTQIQVEKAPEPQLRLVVDKIVSPDGKVILYCVHWQPCQRCEFTCIR